jgi:ABC-2 type transport system permease protein
MLTATFRFEFFRLRRNFAAVFFAIAFPLMMLVFFGLVFRGKPNGSFGGRSTVTSTLPGYLALIAAVTGLMSFPLGLAEYREKGVLRRFFSTPLRATHLLVSQAAANVVLSLAGIALCLVAAFAALGANLPKRPLLAAILLVASFGAMFSIGLFIAAIAKSERAAVAIANAVYFPMLFVSGATVPLEIMPAGVRNFSRFVPLGACVHALRFAWFGTGGIGTIGPELIVLTISIAAGLFAAPRVFSWSR